MTDSEDWEEEVEPFVPADKDPEVIERVPLDWESTTVLTITPDIVEDLVTDQIASDEVEGGDRLIIRVRQEAEVEEVDAMEDVQTLDEFIEEE